MNTNTCEHVPVTRDMLIAATEDTLVDGYRLALVAAHDDNIALRIVYVWVRAGDPVRREITVTVPSYDAWLPSLAGVSFTAGRFEREIHDLFGIQLINHPLPRRLVRHSHWPKGWYPMRRDVNPNPIFRSDDGDYPFVEVAGDGVYEIPVGPVHAGMIEPGHFRFSAVGETILKLKARLWFVHRGIEKLFEGKTPDEGIALAERVSGDTAVGHNLTYAKAVENALGIEVPEQDRVARAILLELERMYNHIGDIGALANNVGYGIINSHALRLRETLLRLNKQVTGHRLLRGAIVIGGSQLLSLPDPQTIEHVAAQAVELAELTVSNSVARDRFTATSILPTTQARELGTLGYVARASGIPIDARSDHPDIDLGPSFHVVTEESGDVLARFQVRAREITVSAEVIADLLPRASVTSLSSQSPDGLPRQTTALHCAGFGQVEAWRGTTAWRVEIGADGRLSRVKIVDPSFFNWPALPVALTGAIVPDFPLTNKSFNQSYAGNDL